MTRREAAQSALLVFGVALVVRIWFASQIPFPELQDAAYYFGVARNLVEGRGLVTDSIWSYQTPPLVFPRPAFEVWLPLPSLLAAIPMAVLGATFAASQVSAVIIGAIVPVLGWRLAADVAAERELSPERSRTLAIGTGLVCAVYLPLLIHSALPNSTMLFTVLALTACLLMSRVARSDGPVGLTDRRVVALGLVIGLAALTRNEAIWLGFIWLLIAWRAHQLRLVVVVGAVSLLVFAPWAIRDWLVFGSPLPGQAVANAFSVTGLDIFAWNDPPSLSRYLAVGPARLIEMRVEGFSHNLLTVLLLPGVPLSLIGLVALPVAGAWSGRPTRRPPRPDHVPRHQPDLPGGDHVGHLPPRGRGRPGPDRAVRAARARRGDRPTRASAWLDATGGVARAGPRDLRVGAVLGRPADRVRLRRPRDRSPVRRTRTPDGSDRPSA